MKKSRHSDEKIIAAVKQLEGGRKTADVARELGVSQQTLYAWKNKYSGMQVNDAKRLRQLEDENRRLKHLVADLTLDKEVMKAVIAKNGWSSWAPMRGADSEGCRSAFRIDVDHDSGWHRGRWPEIKNNKSACRRQSALFRSASRATRRRLSPGHQAKIRRRPLGSGIGSPNSLAVSIQRRMASCALPRASSCVGPCAEHPGSSGTSAMKASSSSLQ